MFISDESIRIVHLVAKYQSITTAAEQLNKVPSAISYTVKNWRKVLAWRYLSARDGILS